MLSCKRAILGASAVLVIAGCTPSLTADDTRAEPIARPTAMVLPHRMVDPTPVGTSAGAPADTTAEATEALGEKIGITETTAARLPANLPPFEGELALRVPGKSTQSLDYAMKGDKIRLGIGPFGGASKGIDAIIDTDDKKATILLNDRKEFVEIDLGKVAAEARQRYEALDVAKTGKTSTVAGRECEEWKISDRDIVVDACVVKGAPYFDLDALEKSAGFVAPPWVHRVVDSGYVPLRVSIRDAKGKTLGTSEITETSRTVDSSQFDVPVGYRKAAPPKVPAAGKK